MWGAGCGVWGELVVAREIRDRKSVNRGSRGSEPVGLSHLTERSRYLFGYLTFTERARNLFGLDAVFAELGH